MSCQEIINTVTKEANEIHLLQLREDLKNSSTVEEFCNCKSCDYTTKLENDAESFGYEVEAIFKELKSLETVKTLQATYMLRRFAINVFRTSAHEHLMSGYINDTYSNIVLTKSSNLYIDKLGNIECKKTSTNDVDVLTHSFDEIGTCKYFPLVKLYCSLKYAKNAGTNQRHQWEELISLFRSMTPNVNNNQIVLGIIAGPYLKSVESKIKKEEILGKAYVSFIEDLDKTCLRIQSDLVKLKRL